MHKVLQASWEMPVVGMFSVRVQRRHLENSSLGTAVGMVGPCDQVGRVQASIPFHF